MGFLFFHKSTIVCIGLGFAIPITAYNQYKWMSVCQDPFTINVTGSSRQLSNITIDWSWGEASIIKTLHAYPSYILSTGFLQSKNDPLLLFKNLDSFALQIKIGPNPFTDFIQITMNQEGIAIHAIQLFNAQGILLYQMKGNYSGLGFYHKIKMEAHDNSIYYLVVNYTIGDFMTKSKYFKLIQN
jgi:hypothetical protein